MRTALRTWYQRMLWPVTIAIHVAAALVLALTRHWIWALSIVVVNHGVLTAAGLWPRSRLLGPNHTRLSAKAQQARCVALTIDDGPDPAVTPQVLELLEQHAATATFFCIGERVLRYAALAQDIRRRGHQLDNHSQSHRLDFSLLGPQALRLEIERAQSAIGATVGARPRYFRAPAGLRSPFLQPVLDQVGLELVSWTRRGFDAVVGDADRVFNRLVRNLAPGDILLLHDGHAARDATGRPVILTVLPKLLAAIAAAGLKTVPLSAGLE